MRAIYLVLSFLLTRYCMERVSSCNIYAVQQDTHNVLMSKFIHYICLARHISDLIGPSSGAFYKLYLQIWYVVLPVLLDASSHYEAVGRINAPEDGPVRSETCRANICDENMSS